MDTDVAGGRYRTWYAMLLRLYPRPFRERFGEGMAQTFHDLCRECRDPGLGLFVFILWIFFETSVGIVKENTTHMPQIVKTMLRVALGALAVLMVPLVASQFVEDWNWPVGAFVRVYVLFSSGRGWCLRWSRGGWARGRTRRALVWRCWPGSPWGGLTWSMWRTPEIPRT